MSLRLIRLWQDSYIPRPLFVLVARYLNGLSLVLNIVRSYLSVRYSFALFLFYW
ncbi:hypothetical protein WZ342_2283 [Enterococcus faecalis]|nr:hypothetical protein WZ342_2283 [Enterococcus faecalis]